MQVQNIRHYRYSKHSRREQPVCTDLRLKHECTAVLPLISTMTTAAKVERLGIACRRS